jgi:hypothetical protein
MYMCIVNQNLKTQTIQNIKRMRLVSGIPLIGDDTTVGCVIVQHSWDCKIQRGGREEHPETIWRWRFSIGT